MIMTGGAPPPPSPYSVTLPTAAQTQLFMVHRLRPLTPPPGPLLFSGLWLMRLRTAHSRHDAVLVGLVIDCAFSFIEAPGVQLPFSHAYRKGLALGGATGHPFTIERCFDSALDRARCLFRQAPQNKKCETSSHLPELTNSLIAKHVQLISTNGLCPCMEFFAQESSLVSNDNTVWFTGSAAG